MKSRKYYLYFLFILLSGCAINLGTSSSSELLSSSNLLNISNEISDSTAISTSTLPNSTSSGSLDSTSNALSTSLPNSTASLIESSQGPIDDVVWTYENFFDPTTTLQIQIHIEKSQLLAIQQDYNYYSSFSSKSPIYRMCNVTFTIEEESITLLEVGIRMKGNTSRTNFITDDGDIYELIHYKLSFSETFDDVDYYQNPKVWVAAERTERKNRTFLGMEKLDLKWNRGMDSTYIKENYIYTVFRENGIVAPHETLTPLNLQIDNSKSQSLGLFYAIEAVDKIFIDRHFSAQERGGDLYKATWGYCGGGHYPADLNSNISQTCVGVEDEDERYFPMYDLKTNKKTSTHANIWNFINKINQLDKDSLSLVLDDILDVDNFLLLEAIAYMGGNPDDLRNNGNNYYLYFTKNENKAVFIPYDWDWSLGIKRGWNPTGNAMTETEPYTRMMMSDRRGQTNPLYSKIFIKNGVLKYQLQFKSYLENILNSKWFKDDQAFVELFNTYSAKYSHLVKPTIEGVADEYRKMELGNYNNLSDSNDNIPFNLYLQLKRQTANNNLNNYF